MTTALQGTILDVGAEPTISTGLREPCQGRTEGDRVTAKET